MLVVGSLSEVREPARPNFQAAEAREANATEAGTREGNSPEGNP